MKILFVLLLLPLSAFAASPSRSPAATPTTTLGVCTYDSTAGALYLNGQKMRAYVPSSAGIAQSKTDCESLQTNSVCVCLGTAYYSP